MTPSRAARGPVAPASERAKRAAAPATAPPPSSARRRLVVQAKLLVGSTTDPAEREADAIAGQVIESLERSDGGVERPEIPVAGTRVARSATTIGAGGGPVDGETEERIVQARSGGRPLDGKVRRRMEGAFGADFSDVRVHVGRESDHLNDQFQARAFTSGSDIFVRSQDYAPGTNAGQRLLAHELTHTIQQGGARRTMNRSSVVRRDFTALKNTPGLQTTTPTAPSPTEGHENVNEYLEGVSKSGSTTSTVKDIDDYKDDLAKAQGKGENAGEGKSGAVGANITTASGAADTIEMFVGLSKAIASFRKGEGGWEKTGAVLEGIGSVTQGAKGVGNMVQGGSKAANPNLQDGIGQSKEAAQGLSGIADAFTGIKETFFAIKKIVELVRDAQEMTAADKAKKSFDLIRGLLEGAKAGVSAAKSFMDLANSTVTGAMVQSVPGLGIAIGCVEIIIRATDLIVAAIRAHDMAVMKRETKGKWGIAKGTTGKQKAEQLLAGGSAQEKEEAQEYLTAKSLEYINDKRVRRAILKMCVSMAKIAGDAATLGGASAPVGIGLKVGAVALDVGAGIFRKFKQYMRDKTETMAPGKAKTFFSKIFNTDKTTAKKEQEYNRIIEHIFTMIEKVSTTDLAITDATNAKKKAAEAQVARIDRYVSALGMSLSTMEAIAKSKGAQKLRDKMLEMLKQRE